jgi:hypothetical protein
MNPLEAKESGGKLLPHTVLRVRFSRGKVQPTKSTTKYSQKTDSTQHTHLESQNNKTSMIYKRSQTAARLRMGSEMEEQYFVQS